MKTIQFAMDNPPPSANSCWRHAGKRTYRTKNYETWKNHVRKHLMYSYKVAGGTTIVGDKPFTMDVALHFKSKRKRDLDNYLKPLLDTLEGFLFDDDSQLTDLTVSKRIKQEADCVSILITY